GTDARLFMVREPAERDLLARVDVLGRDQGQNLLRARDRARNDGALYDGRGGHPAVRDEVGTGSTRGDVPLRDEHLHGGLALLDVTLVVGDVERRQQRRDEREADCDCDVANTVGHAAGFLFVFYSRRSWVLLVRLPDLTTQPRMLIE